MLLLFDIVFKRFNNVGDRSAHFMIMGLVSALVQFPELCDVR